VRERGQRTNKKKTIKVKHSKLNEIMFNEIMFMVVVFSSVTLLYKQPIKLIFFIIKLFKYIG